MTPIILLLYYLKANITYKQSPKILPCSGLQIKHLQKYQFKIEAIYKKSDEIFILVLIILNSVKDDLWKVF